MEHHELSFCEKPRARKYSTLDDITVKTLKPQMEAVERAVQERVRACLAGKPLGLLIDAWTEGLLTTSP